MRSSLPSHRASSLLGLGFLAVACGDPTDAPRLRIPVTTESMDPIPVVTDLGYEMSLSTARIAIQDVLFTATGEVQAASWWRRRATHALMPPAYAHPGHAEGGEVTGELLGRFVVEGVGPSRELGIGTLLAGTYAGVNFTFDRGSLEVLGAGDPLIEHTAFLSGTARRNGEAVAFTVIIDSPEGRALLGVPFSAELRADSAGHLGLRFHSRNPFGADTLFDGIDFLALDRDDDRELRIQPGSADVEEAYNAIRRRFQTHDFFSVQHEN